MMTAFRFPIVVALVAALAACGGDELITSGFVDDGQTGETDDRRSPPDETPGDGPGFVETDPGSLIPDSLDLEGFEPLDLPPDSEEPSDDQTPVDTSEPVDELEGWIGSRCGSVADCEFDGAQCLGEADGFPNGMCVQGCDRLCPDQDGFPTTFCVDTEAIGGGACHSRCDYLAYPGVGCRQGYACDVMPRFGDPNTSVGACVPDDGSAGGLSECMQWLVDHGAVFEPTTYTPRHPSGNTSLTCTVIDPVRLQSPVQGVNFRYYYDTPGDFGSMLMSCQLARAISEMSTILHDEFDVTEVVHVGTTNCRQIANSNRLSQHGLGKAIDISGFFDDGANWYGIEDHWEHGTDNPATTEGQLLYQVAHRMYDDWIFNVILTPEFNDAHDNHFHVDMTDGSHYLGSHDELWGPFMGPNEHDE